MALAWDDTGLYRESSNLTDLRGLGLAGGMSSCAVFVSVNCSGNIFDSGSLVVIILRAL